MLRVSNSQIDMGMTIIGMYEYDDTLFANLHVPTGISVNVLRKWILHKCGNLACMYTNLDYLKLAIGLWSDAHQWEWMKLYGTTNLTYNPIWNKDGTITETHVHGAKTNQDAYGQDSETVQYGATEKTKTNGARSGETINSVQGFNSANYVPSDKTNTTDAQSVDTEADAIHSDTSTRQARTDTHTEQTYTDTDTRIETGNIGITTTQQMIKEEREISEFSIYDYIADDFKREFCVMVY